MSFLSICVEESKQEGFVLLVLGEKRQVEVFFFCLFLNSKVHSFCVFSGDMFFSPQDTRITLYKTHTETSTGAQAHTIWMRGTLIQKLYSHRFNSVKCQHNRMPLPCPPKLWQHQTRRSRCSMVTEQYVAIVCILDVTAWKILGVFWNTSGKKSLKWQTWFLRYFHHHFRDTVW